MLAKLNKILGLAEHQLVEGYRRYILLSLDHCNTLSGYKICSQFSRNPPKLSVFHMVLQFKDRCVTYSKSPLLQKFLAMNFDY